MNDIFSFINVESLGVAFLVLLIWNIILTFKVIKQGTEAGVKSLSGDSSREIQETISGQANSLKKMEKDIETINSYSKENHSIALRGIQNVGVIRFNPFKGVGGDQSFAIALLDAYGNGLTVSSLYSREGTRIYAKPVKKMVSPYTLTQEEKEAIAGAMGQSSAN